MYCFFPSLSEGSQCQFCPYRLKRSYEEHPLRECGVTTPAPCRWRREQLGEIRVACTTREHLLPLYRCGHPANQKLSRNGRPYSHQCTPGMSRDWPIVLSCHHCPEYEAAAAGA